MTTNNSIDSINGVKVAGIHTLNAQTNATPTTWDLPKNSLTTSTLMNAKITNIDAGSNLIALDTAITAAGLASGGHIVVLPATTGGRYKVRSMIVNFPTTSFVLGDRDIQFTISTGNVWSRMPSANVLTLDNATWGSATLPFPSGVSTDTPTTTSNSIFAEYVGGTTDYSDGDFDVTILYEKIT